MNWGAGILASFLVVLPRPATWIVALAAFLVRGGIVVFLVPILVLPSPVGLANIFAPTITTFWLGGMSLGFAAVVTAIFAAFFAWLVIGGWVAAVTERDLIRLVAEDDDLDVAGAVPRPSAPRRRGRIWRIVVVRLAAHVPLAIALGYGSLRLVQATYRELTLPTDVVTPIAWRVISTTPDAVAAIVLAWALGEIIGSLAARRLVLWGQSIDLAYAGAWADLVRRPMTTIATFAIPALAVAVTISPVVLAAGIVWETLRAELAGALADDAVIVLATTLAFVVVWTAGLVVAGLLAAWRSAAWTVESLRVRGTFGSFARSHSGDWNDPESSGSLGRPA